MRKFLTTTWKNSVKNGLYVSGPFNARFDSNVLGEFDPDGNRIIVSGNDFINNDIGAHFESGLIDLTGATNNFIGGRVGLRFSPFDFSTIKGKKHYGGGGKDLLDDGYYGGYEDYRKITPRVFGAWQGYPLYTHVPREGLCRSCIG